MCAPAWNEVKWLGYSDNIDVPASAPELFILTKKNGVSRICKSSRNICPFYLIPLAPSLDDCFRWCIYFYSKKVWFNHHQNLKKGVSRISNSSKAIWPFFFSPCWDNCFSWCKFVFTLTSFLYLLSSSCSIRFIIGDMSDLSYSFICIGLFGSWAGHLGSFFPDAPSYSTLSNHCGLFHSWFWIELKSSVGVKGQSIPLGDVYIMLCSCIH